MALRVFNQAASNCLRRSTVRSRSGFRIPTNSNDRPISNERITKLHRSFDNLIIPQRRMTRIDQIAALKKSASDIVMSSKNQSSVLKCPKESDEVVRPRKKDKKEAVKVTSKKRNPKRCQDNNEKSKEEEKRNDYETAQLIYKAQKNKSLRNRSVSSITTPNLNKPSNDLEKCNAIIENFKSLNPNVILSSPKGKLNVPWYSYSDTVSVKPLKTNSGTEMQTRAYSKTMYVDRSKVNVESVMREWHNGNHMRIDELLTKHENEEKRQKEIEKLKVDEMIIPAEKRSLTPPRNPAYSLMTTSKNYKTSSINKSSLNAPVNPFKIEHRPLQLPELRRLTKKYVNIEDKRNNKVKVKVVEKRADDDKNVHVRKPLPSLSFGKYENNNLGSPTDYHHGSPSMRVNF